MPSGKSMPSKSAKKRPTVQSEQAAESSKRLRAAYLLLGMVGLMAVAMAIALAGTLRETMALSRPYQRTDNWYVSSVHRELARAALLAHQVHDGKATPEDLQERVEVLLSTHTPDKMGTKLSDQAWASLPNLSTDLTALFKQATSWANQLDSEDPDVQRHVVEQIMAQSDALLDSIRQVVVSVHTFSSEEEDRVRKMLHERFMLLSMVLGGLLIGTTLLILKLIKDTRAASAMSQQLSAANRQLEVRVADRTRKIEEGRALLNFMLDTSPSDVVLSDVNTGRVHFINHKMTSHLELKSAPSNFFLHDLIFDTDASAKFMQTLDDYGQVDAMEARIGTTNPRWSSLSARLIEVEGQLAHLLWAFDISRHKQLEDQLRELASRDALSGLLNRRAFLERSTALFDHCRRHNQPCAVLMIDIDHFKTINDRYGHQMGDEAIRACANAINKALRDADVLGRLGGEEFAVVLPHSSAQSAVGVAERVRMLISQIDLRTENSTPVQFTVSIGVAQMGPQHATVEPLIAESDQALYRAKATGRNKVVTYDPSLPHF